ncbi:hypothetical protein FQV27_10530 [Paracoccus aurantiacus]|uniref:Sulfotransferase family protein n=1 Tax=Paracoccus aurantiacus TaxID=2599412 RepID=A0A5C6S3N2_9RHOB|nr:hypothetical protein [Paracoccus aurantiacus]TXB68431.1 hypothetical protein FQV27_10530 [Paracoccus aurantiacus]
MSIRIHIGAHKTATTELQRALLQTTKRLARGGMGFLGPETLRGEGFPFHLALRSTQPALAEKVAGLFDDRLAQFRNLLISEENILGTTARTSVIGRHGQLYPGAERLSSRAFSLLRGRDVVLFLAVRDPADFVTSAYSQQLRRPLPLHHDVYLRDFSLPAISWTDLARRLLNQPQVQKIICWQYEDYAVLRPRILTEMVGRRAAARVPPSRVVNSGISAAAYDAFVAEALTDDETPTQTLLRDACRRFPKSPGEPSFRILSSRVHDESRAQYAQDLDSLAGLDRVRLLRPQPGDGAPSPDAADPDGSPVAR